MPRMMILIWNFMPEYYGTWTYDETQNEINLITLTRDYRVQRQSSLESECIKKSKSFLAI